MAIGLVNRLIMEAMKGSNRSPVEMISSDNQPLGSIVPPPPSQSIREDLKEYARRR